MHVTHPTLGKRLIMSEAKSEDLTGIGIEPTPENLEFINQLAEAASVGAPLAQPYIDSGAIRVFQKEVMPGVTFQAIGFHNTKLAEMLKSPASHYN